MLAHPEGHGPDWVQVLLRKPPADSSKRVGGFVVLNLEDLPILKEVQSDLPGGVQDVTLAVAQTDVGDAPFWVAEKRDVVHLASFRFHLKAHKKLLAGVPWHSAASQGGGQGHQATAIKPPTAPTAPVIRHMQHGLCPSKHGRHGQRNRAFVWRHLHFPQEPATFMLSHTRARGKPSAGDAVPSAGQGRGSLRAAQPHGRHRTKLPPVHPPCVPVWKLHFQPVSRAFTQDGHGFTCQHLVHAFRAVRGF